MTHSLLLAFDLGDGRPEWTEVALALGLSFVAAYVVSMLFGRLVRWVLQGVLGTDPARHRQVVGQPLLFAKVVIFLIAFAGFSLPLLDALGLPFELGMDRHTLRGWVFGSGLRIIAVLLVAGLVMRISQTTAERLERELARGDGLDVIERARRARTLGRLVHNLIAVFVTSIALLMVLHELGVDIVPMLTGAGILGAAIMWQKRVVDTGWDPAPRRERTGDADGAGRDAAPEPAMAARIAPPRGAPTPPPPPPD